MNSSNNHEDFSLRSLYNLEIPDDQTSNHDHPNLDESVKQPIESSDVAFSSSSSEQPYVNTSGESIPIVNHEVYPNPNPLSSSVMVDSSNSFSYSDEELLKAFVGEKYDSFLNSKFNIGAFFFNVFYLFYRKMYIYGLLCFVVNFFLLTVFKIPFLFLIFCFILGLVANSLYLSFARQKVDSIKRSSHSNLIEVCRVQGGVSIFGVILGIVLEIVTILVMAILAAVFGFSSFLGSFTKSVSNVTNGEFDGTLLYDTSVPVVKLFSMDVPSKFMNQNSSSDTDSYFYSYSSGTGVFNSCQFSFSVPKGYSDAKDLIQQMSDFYQSENASNVSELVSNGITWYSFSYSNGLGTFFYSGTVRDNKVFLFDYEIGADTDAECAMYSEPLLNSIQNK